MPSQKKFLDIDGLTYFAQKLDEYPTNEVLGTVINAIDLVKANINSPAFTGTPTAPTPSAGDSSDKIATTAFVMAAMQGSIRITILNGFAGLTATATLEDGSYSNSASANASGIISIPVQYYGSYRISYSDVRVKGDSYATVSSNTPIELAARYTTLVEYTVRIDESNSNPNTSCVYMNDAINMTKGSSAWLSNPIFEDIKPCVFKNGAVNYYLNPNDFSKKLDGTSSVLTGADGDVMIEFRKFAYKIVREGQYLYVSITNDEAKALADPLYTYDAFSRITEGDLDKFYQGAFKGYIDNNGYLRSIAGVQPTANKTIGAFRAAAQARNTVNGNANIYHYQQNSYAHLKALQCLYLIMYGNRNGQEALGRGVVGVTDDGSSNLSYVTGYNAAADDGTITGTVSSATSTFASGMCSGTTSNSVTHMKLFGIEDFWGSIWEWIDGFTTDADRNIITSWNSFTGEPVIEITSSSHASGLTANASGWNKMVAGTSDAGFMPVEWGGSSSTYWADLGRLCASCVLDFGGGWSSGDAAGPFLLYASDGASDSSRSVGARLAYN